MLGRNKMVTVEVQNYDIISCRERSGEFISWEEEECIRYEMKGERNDFNFRNEEREFEERLIRRCGVHDRIAYDDVYDELHLYRFYRWNEYTLKLTYVYGGNTFEIITDYEPDFGQLQSDGKLYVSFYSNDPEHIISISEDNVSIVDFFRRPFRRFIDCHKKNS